MSEEQDVMTPISADKSRLTGPKEIENAGITFVIQQEALAGRTAVDTRHDKTAVADLVSGDRLIEIKAAGGTSRGNDLWLEPAQYQAAKAHPVRFWLYLVENVRQGDPEQFRLLRLGVSSCSSCSPAPSPSSTTRSRSPSRSTTH